MVKSESYFEAPNLRDVELGRKLVIPSDAVLKEAPSDITFHERHYELLIGIGEDSTASLILSESALEDLKAYKNDISI